MARYQESVVDITLQGFGDASGNGVDAATYMQLYRNHLGRLTIPRQDSEDSLCQIPTVG